MRGAREQGEEARGGPKSAHGACFAAQVGAMRADGVWDWTLGMVLHYNSCACAALVNAWANDGAAPALDHVHSSMSYA